MEFEDQPTPPPPTPGGPSRRAAALAAIAIALLLVIAVAAVLAIRADGDAVGALPEPGPPQSTSGSTSTTVDTSTEVVARLREILRVRDRAFHERDADLLNDVYTVDCPCLEGDTNAIEELVSKRYRLIGGATSIRVRRSERVNGRLWLVIADFRSAPARIETEDGVLVRRESAGSDLFQFALARPVDADEWLLGRATSYRSG